MNIEAWVAVIAVGLTIVGLLLGAAWWMSALYSRVCTIDAKCDHIDERFCQLETEKQVEHRRLWKAIESTRRNCEARGHRLNSGEP